MLFTHRIKILKDIQFLYFTVSLFVKESKFIVRAGLEVSPTGEEETLPVQIGSLADSASNPNDRFVTLLLSRVRQWGTETFSKIALCGPTISAGILVPRPNSRGTSVESSWT
jgi:hypothetical protein